MNVSICRHCMSIWVGSPRSLRSLSMPLGAKALQRLPIRGHVSGPRHVRCANVSFISVDIILQSDVIFFFFSCEVHPTIWIQPDLSYGFLVTVSAGASVTHMKPMKPQFFRRNLTVFSLVFRGPDPCPIPHGYVRAKDLCDKMWKSMLYIYIFLISYLFSFHHFISRFFKILCLMFWSWERIGITRIWLVWVAPAQFKAALGYDNWICAQDG